MKIIKVSKSQIHGMMGAGMGILIILSQGLSPVREKISAYRRSALSFLTQTESTFYFAYQPNLWFKSQSSLQRQILEYELRVRQQDAQISRLSTIERENEDLRASIDKLPSQRVTVLVATLLHGSSGRFLVDVGEADGVRSGDIVLARGIFLGTVIETEKNLSTLASIFDSQIRIGARIDSGGSSGVLTRKGDYLSLTTISRSEEVKVGDKVVTLGDEKVRQQGLLIGYVSHILTRPADPVSSFIIKPAIKDHQVISVIVMKE